MFKKAIIFCAIIFFAIAIIFAVAFYRVSNYDSTSGVFSLNINQQEKSTLKKIAREIKDWIYYEATIHNPEGDMLPDEIDDRIMEEIKSKIK